MTLSVSGTIQRENTDIGSSMYTLMQRLFPICRSITGDGVRETLKIISEYISVTISEVPSGTKAFDWTVPLEWNVQDAYVKNSKGEKIIDFKKSNLHLLNYSVPTHLKVSRDELRKHLFTSSQLPESIPYLTSYYKQEWGFCVTQKQFDELKDDTYEVLIDSSLKEGALTYGEFYVKGEHEEEILFSTYLCHPSMCNDNLSGVVLSTLFAKHLTGKRLKYSYRFLFLPETIGSIVWLSRNESKLSKIKHGLVLTCVGDPGHSTYKKSKMGNALIDQVVEKVLIDSGAPFEILDFWPTGSDERQFCSPGFNLPVGSLMRTPYARYPEYHTSKDDLEFVKPEFLADSFRKYNEAVYILENNATYLNLNPKCEPQLGKRGIYSMLGGQHEKLDQVALLWVLTLSDGSNSLLDIAKRSKVNFKQIKIAADVLLEHQLLKKVELK